MDNDKKWMNSKLVSKDIKYSEPTNIKYSEPEKTTGSSGVIPISVLKEDYNIEILPCI